MIYFTLLFFPYRFTYFIKQRRLKDSQCLLVAHHQPNYSVQGYKLNCKCYMPLFWERGIHHTVVWISVCNLLKCIAIQTIVHSCKHEAAIPIKAFKAASACTCEDALLERYLHMPALDTVSHMQPTLCAP